MMVYGSDEFGSEAELGFCAIIAHKLIFDVCKLLFLRVRSCQGRQPRAELGDGRPLLLFRELCGAPACEWAVGLDHILLVINAAFAGSGADRNTVPPNQVCLVYKILHHLTIRADSGKLIVCQRTSVSEHVGIQGEEEQGLWFRAFLEFRSSRRLDFRFVGQRRKVKILHKGLAQFAPFIDLTKCFINWVVC